MAHTAQLEAATLDAARRLVVAAFDARPVAARAGGFTEVDWEHALGGMLKDPDAPHASQARRGPLHRGRSIGSGVGRPSLSLLPRSDAATARR